MTYPVNPNDPTTPTNQQGATQGAEEFRALKAVVAALVVAGAASASTRQSIQSAIIDANGYNAALTVGAGLRPGLSATVADPLHLSYAAGFALGKAIDNTEALSANIADILAADLPANNTSYLYRVYATAFGATLIPPQYGYTFDRTQHSLMQYVGVAGSTVFLDDLGNVWAAQGGARVQTNQFKYGTGGLGGAGAANILNGAADFIKSTSITKFPDGGWTIRGWCYPTTLPGAGNHVRMASFVNAGGFGAELGIFNNAGTIKFTYNLSSSGAANNIASGVQGTTTPIVNNWYFVELTYDVLATTYRLYVNGAQEQSTVGGANKICSITQAAWGAAAGGGANSFFFGYLDKSEFRSYCDHPNGTAYVSPVGAPSVTNQKIHFFSNTPKKQMFEVTAPSLASGTNPTLTPVIILYLGEADTSGVAVTAIRNYQIQRQYDSGWTNTLSAAGVAVPKAHNLGWYPDKTDFTIECLLTEAGYNPGEQIKLPGVLGDNATFVTAPSIAATRNNLSLETSGNPYFVLNKATGVRTALTPANWRYRITARMDW